MKAALITVLALLPLTAQAHPAPTRDAATESARLIDLQGEDGLWRAGLLDPMAAPQAQASSLALEVYALTTGIAAAHARNPRLPRTSRAWIRLEITRFDDPSATLAAAIEAPLPTTDAAAGAHEAPARGATGPLIPDPVTDDPSERRPAPE